jgi:hypothetical protein
MWRADLIKTRIAGDFLYIQVQRLQTRIQRCRAGLGLSPLKNGKVSTSAAKDSEQKYNYLRLILSINIFI